MLTALAALSGEAGADGTLHRRWVARRGPVLPSHKHMYGVAPAVVPDKADPRLASWSVEAVHGPAPDMLDLIAAA